MRFAFALALAPGLTALACEAEPLEVNLELRGQNCAAEDLAQVRVVSIEIYGSTPEAPLCTLGRRCVFADTAPTSIDAIAELLHDVNQPLVDAEVAGAEYLHVVGRATCWDQPDPTTGILPTPPTCGSNDLAEIDGDVLAVTMRCDMDCAAEQVPLCD
jgi:hypothetical protein